MKPVPLILLLIAQALLAAQGLLAAETNSPLAVEPERVELHGPAGRAQLVVTARDGKDRLADLTHDAAYAVENPAVAEVSPTGAVSPRGPGETHIIVRACGGEQRVPVSVVGWRQPTEVSFHREVVPILTRAGCNAGVCHGAPMGKNGFRLSLRGYDPALDYQTISREIEGRRLNLLEPDSSLVLLKAIGQVGHEGGRRLDPNGDGYALLRGWIAGGAAVADRNAEPRLVKLQVSPERRLLEAPHASQQLRSVATFSDGRVLDVTHLTRFSSTDETQAIVTQSGKVERRQHGEVAIVAEYLNMMATARLIFLQSAGDFAWSATPEHNEIDRHVFAKLKLLRIAPSPLTRDDEFLRRAYLDAIGKLPTAEETRRFLADADPQKRARVIDALLERPEFADWWAMKWTDRLGCNQRFVGKIGALKYHQWIKDAISQNLPEDEFARTILTGSGGNYGNPPAGFWRRLRDPQLRAEEVSQLFLGVRLQCAKCHNHPGERWTQDDYHSFAAFFARMKYRDGPFFIQVYDKEETVYATREGEVTHPRTGVTLPPRFLGGDVPQIGPELDRRDVLARWLTSPENPYFARAAANRIWYHLFGRGIVEPVDDMRSTNPPCNEPLLDALAAELVKSGFDRKHLIRLIMNSRTYQLSSQTTPSNSGDEKYFSHGRVRLLQAEQLLDAVCSVTGVPEKFPNVPLGTPATALPDGEYKHPFLEAFGRPARAMACECERDGDTNFGQALQMVGGRLVHDKVHSDNGRVASLLREGKTDAELVDELFLATLCRYPAAEEKQVLMPRLAGAGPNRRRVAEDILWSLLNHSEFLFQH